MQKKCVLLHKTSKIVTDANVQHLSFYATVESDMQVLCKQIAWLCKN